MGQERHGRLIGVGVVHGGRGPCAAAWGLVLDDTAAQLVATATIPPAVMVQAFKDADSMVGREVEQIGDQ